MKRFIPAIVASSLLTAPALADEEFHQQCADAYQQVQELRLETKLSEASKRAQACAQEACPNVVRDTCAKWLVELRETIPSIVVRASAPSGEDVLDVKLYIDDALVSDGLDGRAIDVDPGKHTIRLETCDGSDVEQQVLASAGDQNRVVAIADVPNCAPVVDEQPGKDPIGDGKVVPEDDGPPVGAFVLGGIGLASVGAFGVLAAIGTGELSDLEDTCGQTRSCSDDQVAGPRTKIIAGDILLAVGVLAVGAAITWLIVDGVSSGGAGTDESARVELSPTVGGGVLTVTF